MNRRCISLNRFNRFLELKAGTHPISIHVKLESWIQLFKLNSWSLQVFNFQVFNFTIFNFSPFHGFGWGWSPAHKRQVEGEGEIRHIRGKDRCWSLKLETWNLKFQIGHYCEMELIDSQLVKCPFLMEQIVCKSIWKENCATIRTSITIWKFFNRC